MMVGKDFVLIFVGIFLISFVSSGLYYELEMEYDSGEVVVKNVGVIYSRIDRSNYYSSEDDVLGYDIELLNNLREKVYSEYISVPNLEIWDSFDEDVGSGEISLDNVSFNVYLPYFENVNEIVVEAIGGGEVVSEIDVGVYAKVREDVFVMDGDGDGDVVGDVVGVDVVGDGGANNLVYLILGIVFLVVVAFGIAFWLGKKRG